MPNASSLQTIYMAPSKEYALFCEFSTVSANGLQSYMHVFDRTTFEKGSGMALRAFFATRLVHLPEEASVELYMTDGHNTLVDGGQFLKGKVKGPNANLVARIQGLPVKAPGEYRVWARIDGGEPMQLCTWEAVEKN